MIIPTNYEIQAAAQIEFAGDKGKQEAFAAGVAWALTDTKEDEELRQTIKDLTKGLQTIVDSSWFDERSPETKMWITALIEKANDY